MAVPADQDLTITRGDTETIVANLTTEDGTAINITGRTYRAQIRNTQDASVINASFTCTVTNGSEGQVTCVLSAADSALLKPGLSFWDLEENASGIVSTVLAGSVTVLADVSR